jgi:hypothetical protein
MSNIDYTGKYIELIMPITIYSHEDGKFLERIRDQVLKDPDRKAYIRRSIDNSEKWTIYVNIPCEYSSLGYKVLYDEEEIKKPQ